MEPQHYFSRHPAVGSRPARARLVLPDLELELLTDRGVFAHGRVDRGTELLLRTAPVPATGDLLDLGCGYGPIALALASRSPGCRVWAVDVNERALALCEENARAAGLGNLRVTQPDEVPADLRLAALYSNPPIRVGRLALEQLLTSWMGRLHVDGHAYLVVQRNLGADSLAASLTRAGHIVDRMRSRAGYRVLDVHSPSGSPHHERSNG